MDEIRCEIVRDIGVLSENSKTGWRKMLRIVKWNGGAEKYDLHDWAPDDSKSGKSGTLTAEEAKALLRLLQAYLGTEVDMHCANEVRPAFRRLADMAERTGCAVLIIGHMNKMSGIKGIYRGLGSIDIPAVARSILFVGRSKGDEDKRYMAQLKNSLAPVGKTLVFEIDDSVTFTGTSDITADSILAGASNASFAPTKTENAIGLLAEKLSFGAVPASELLEYFDGLSISEKTVKNAKKELGVVSRKQGSAWMWELGGGDPFSE